jgi:phage shock protein C
MTRKGNPVNDIHATFASQGLVRPREGRVLAGVVAGLGRRFGINPWPARLLFVLLLLVIPGSQILIYPVLWILMPREGTVPVVATAPATTVTPPPAV